MIAIDTTSSRSNHALTSLIAGYVGPNGAVRPLSSPEGSKSNLIVLFGPDSEEGLTLSGHMDTVPATEPGWSSDPFLARDADGKIYGRGTADMKGFLAIALNAALRASDRGLNQRLALAFTYDEEVGCLGALDLHENHEESLARLPRPTLIGEPTSLEVVRMHKGHTKLRIEVPGRVAHSGYPHLGVNAIERATEVLHVLGKLRQELEEVRVPSSDLFEPVPWPPLNIATILGGSAINIVPGECTIEVGVRPLPGLDTEEVTGRIIDGVTGACDDAIVSLINESPPMETEAESLLHRALCEINGQSESKAVSFATDGGWLSRSGLECVIWGPGAIEVAHKPDEYIPISEMETAASRLEQLIERFC